MSGIWDLMSPINRHALEADAAITAEQIKREREEREIVARERAEQTAIGRQRFIDHRGYSPEELIASRAGATRDRAAELGSEANPAIVAGGVTVNAPPPGVKRSAAPVAAVLRRAREASADEFMRREIVRFDARQAERRELLVARQRRADELTAAGVSPAEAELTARTIVR